MAVSNAISQKEHKKEAISRGLFVTEFVAETMFGAVSNAISQKQEKE